MEEKTKKTKVAKKQEFSFDNMNLSKEQLKKATELANAIDHTKSDAVRNFGVETQKKLGGFSSDLMDKIKTKDAGAVGDVITSLMVELKGMDVEGIGEKNSFLANLPFIGKLFDKAEQSMMKYKSVSENIDDIVVKLADSRKALIRNTATLDNLYEKNVDYIGEMAVNIEAGIIKLKELKAVTIPAKEKEVKKDPNNHILVQELNNLVQFENRLEKKIHNLRVSKVVSEQSLPQTKLIQNNNDALVEKIQDSVLTVIPLWKNQVTMALALKNQKEISKASKKVSDTTNELLRNNSTTLRLNTVEIAKENERSIVDGETLVNTNKELIATIDDVLKIQAEGKKEREKTEKLLGKVGEELANKILTARGNVHGEMKEVDSEVDLEEEVEIIELTDENSESTTGTGFGPK